MLVSLSEGDRGYLEIFLVPCLLIFLKYESNEESLHKTIYNEQFLDQTIWFSILSA